ncbi:hypothetical protein Pla52o_34280 [Novipirellula galeiformis]|uniref:Uncharacterized protein n=1 Tax=Novipirellula galeiformis TaxID=2528004 RepID=A0A5C6CE46_9BACT|nr:CbrC family protein [Novipirellula galeiformis]TWU22372.1 hypothetical protein Pla52o_34280 [Novipirellula galeiformis]
METFDDLGMPFPLFKAPVAHARTDPAGTCSVCGTPATIRFCDACYQCFRGGKVDNAIDTELGMVRVEDARLGRTHGLPLGNPPVLGNYELIPQPVDPNFPDETWYHVRIDSQHLFEIIRTPDYYSWQGERWQFCCNRPCAFLGTLPAGALPDSESPADAIANWFRLPDWDAIGDTDFGPLTFYVFQCVSCGGFRYHEDCD